MTHSHTQTSLSQPKQRVYIKPQVEIVNLMPKQTVLGGCFTSSAGSASSQVIGCFYTEPISSCLDH